jgi:hypothetical protein
VIHVPPGSTKQSYVNAWNQWWPMIAHKVQALRISGGEPLISPNFWYWLESFDKVLSGSLRFSINSNFSVEKKYISRLIDHTYKFQNVHIAASIDAVQSMAEYARQGLDFELFLENLHQWCQYTEPHCKIYLQSTVNILNIWGLADKFELAIALRAQYPDKILSCYSTLLRAPEFQSVNLLPADLKKELATTLRDCIKKNSPLLIGNEQAYLEKTVLYLEGDPQPMHTIQRKTLILDLKKFLLRYNETSKHDYRKVYPEKFLAWLDNIPNESDI